jgi:hypothetical protein
MDSEQYPNVGEKYFTIVLVNPGIKPLIFLRIPMALSSNYSFKK